jgi:hypothetical protein
VAGGALDVEVVEEEAVGAGGGAAGVAGCVVLAGVEGTFGAAAEEDEAATGLGC